MTRRRNVRLRVDPAACDGFGHCAELFPEAVALDEWGFPVVTGDSIDPSSIPLATRAVRACPRNALFLEKVPRPAG